MLMISGYDDDDDGDGMNVDVVDDQCNEEDEYFESVCAYCDDGGELICCDGSCLRSFHPSDDGCGFLGFTSEEFKEMQSFLCKNCKYKQHQCFACRKLGSSDKFSGPEVFRCANATCSYFYHPRCVAKLLHPEDKSAAEELGKKITSGETFVCPIHKCCICKKVENKKITELQLAVCRRCPTSYHRKCLPKAIVYAKDKNKEGDDDGEEEAQGEQEEGELEQGHIIPRAWRNLLPNRVLIYCLKHDIDIEIGTPTRDHVRFPDIELKKRRQAFDCSENEKRILLKKRRLISGESFSGKSVPKASKVFSCSERKPKIKIIYKTEKVSSEPDSLREMRVNDASKKSFLENKRSALIEMERSRKSIVGITKSAPVEALMPAKANTNKTSLGHRLYALMREKSGQVKHGKPDMPKRQLQKPLAVKSKKLIRELPSLDADSERRLLALVKEAASSITLEDIMNKRVVPSTYSHSSKAVVDKNITLGKVEAAVESVRTASKMLEEKCSIEDAKAVCGPEVLNQMFRWKSKLKVYLAPFLHGMRYTSYGRHFTKKEKLVKIVELLHWYVDSGDMIVDFCCGANDFSALIKKKLEETGKKCLYKNYDFIQPKNDFNFEKRDWMSVTPDELPKEGSQLIMGLNPPFGVKAALANRFIDKALEFKPKLLILIVPPETERLDKKNPPYDLVWEDGQCLSGKSFYLPGSVDENDKQMDQWNNTAPPLYLWSRPDWSAKHMAIANLRGHLFRQQQGSILERNLSDHPLEDQCYNGDHLYW